MPSTATFLRAALIALVALLVTGPGVNAQSPEISASHLAAAMEAVRASNSDRGLDNVLPTLAEQTQSLLLRTRPDLASDIASAVDDTALKLAVRRADLQADVARVWAKHFTQEELKTITAFYNTAAGKKLTMIGPKVNEEVQQAVRGWSSRVGDELVERTREELKRRGIEF